MKNIWIMAMFAVFSFAFIPQVSAREKEIPQLALPEPTAAYIDTRGVVKTQPAKLDEPVAEKKFSVTIGAGNAYGLGIKIGRQRAKLGLDNSPALTARLGYSLCKYVKLWGDYSRTIGFENHKEYIYPERRDMYNEQHIFSAYTAGIKLTVPITTEEIVFAPYIFGGIGKATFKSIYSGKVYNSYGELIYRWTDKVSNPGIYYKVGGGIDVGVYKNLFLFSEYSYQKMKIEVENLKITFYYSQMMGGIGLKF